MKQNLRLFFLIFAVFFVLDNKLKIIDNISSIKITYKTIYILILAFILICIIARIIRNIYIYYNDRKQTSSLVKNITILCAKINSAKKSSCDFNFLSAFIDIPESKYEEISMLYEDAKKTNDDYKVYAERLNEIVKHYPDEKKEALDIILKCVSYNRQVINLNTQEETMLAEIAQILGITTTEFQNLKSKYETQYNIFSKNKEKIISPIDNPYEVLEVDKNASNDEIKEKWKKLIKENHPDTLTAKGLSKAYVDLANKIMSDINSAYDIIAKERGLK